MSSSGRASAVKLLTGSVDCTRVGVQESDTADSGEESEPTYRHYDNFETDMSLTQDEDEPLESNIPLVQPNAGNLRGMRPPSDAGLLGVRSVDVGFPPPVVPTLPQPQPPRPVSSDSDSERGLYKAEANTDGTSTSTSESEETQIWVPVANRGYGKNGPPSPPQTGRRLSSSSSSAASNRSGSRTLTRVAGGSKLGSSSILLEEPTGREDGRQHAMTSYVSTLPNRQTHNNHSILSLMRHDGLGTLTLDIQGPSIGNHEEDGGRKIQCVTSPDINGGPVLTTLNRDVRPVPFAGHTFTDGLCFILSGLYMLIVLCVGLIFPLAEVFTTPSQSVILETFYIYLYVLSIGFLVLSYVHLMRGQNRTTKGRSRTRFTAEQLPVSPTASLYLRLGALGAGIGSMIKSGLEFGEVLETQAVPDCQQPPLRGVRPALHLCFTFVQLYFVFFNSKMMLPNYKRVALFGLMHLVATNMCVSVEIVVKEIVRDVRDVYDVTYDSASNGTVTGVQLPVSQPCFGHTVMGEVVEMANPYIYLCGVQYSMVCSGILLVMWYKLTQSSRCHADDVSDESSRRSTKCNRSSRGLFAGIFVIVATIIVIITFCVLSKNPNLVATAVKVQHIAKTSVFVVTVLSALLAFSSIRKQTSTGSIISLNLDKTLLVISLVGMTLLCVGSVVAGAVDTPSDGGVLMGVSYGVQVLEAVTQTVLVLNTLSNRQRVDGAPQAQLEAQQPRGYGRDIATFLIACNMALLGINIFEVQRSNLYQLQLQFYGSIAWSIMRHVTEPFYVLFRFHCVVCLACIWKQS